MLGDLWPKLQEFCFIISLLSIFFNICSLSLSFKARWTHPDNVDNDDVVNQCLKFDDNSGSLVANVLRAAATVSIATKLASPWKMLKL